MFPLKQTAQKPPEFRMIEYLELFFIVTQPVQILEQIITQHQHQIFSSRTGPSDFPYSICFS